VENKIVFVAGSRRTKESLLAQLSEYLPPSIEIEGICFHDGIEKPITGNMVIFSSKEAYDDLRDLGLLGEIKKSFICKRTINYENLEEVVNLPRGTRILFVNDKAETTQICIDDLLEMGIDHIDYIPYYPNMPYPVDLEGVRIAVTPGEADKVPAEIGTIIDIGARVIDILSLYKIMTTLGLDESQVDKAHKKYMWKIIHLARKSAEISAQVDLLKRSIRHESATRGHVAQYTFDSIIGSGEAMLRAKTKAQKLAVTELTILIEGESGTGKELFASAIHNESKRKDRPFIAVNFSALPEELVESELFGYVEGAFTGAKKGGKAGIFEMAEGGTIFLDEIGDISPRVQTKLLRVLQEKEIMAVGDTKIKKADIRIIAATNKNLAQMVENNTFRSDLYYRLKMGQIYLPPLRTRKEDINELIAYFLSEYAPGKTIQMEDQVLDILLEHDWQGNIRELGNMIQYMLAVSTEDKLTRVDLPDTHFLNLDDPEKDTALQGLTEEEKQVLEAIASLVDEYGTAGREKISAWLQQQGILFSPGQVRRIVGQLESKGLLKANRGRKGTVIN
jgi:transcriptional regulator with GAF, ATPase, and Fis domain